MRFFGFSCHDGNVAELLELAAKTPWIDSVMFRYNFQQYGNDELNRAIDAAHKAKVGLIAMKTQGSAVSFEPQWKKFEQTGKWNKYQAVHEGGLGRRADHRRGLGHGQPRQAPREHRRRPRQDQAHPRRDRGAVPLRRRHPLGHLRRLRPPLRRRRSAARRCRSAPRCATSCTTTSTASRSWPRSSTASCPRKRGRLPASTSAAPPACPHGVDIAHWMRRAADVLA